MSASPTRILALGLDALSPDLVEAGIADGTLPNLRALAHRGLRGPVHGVDGFYVGSTWPSTYTGRNPAGHGVHYELQLVPGTYDLHRVQDGAFVRAPAVWDVLGEAGRRVAVLDVPLAAPRPRINGVQVVDWGGHDVFFGFRAIPEELEAHLANRYGMHPHGTTCDVRRDGLEAYRDFVDRQIDAVSIKADWTLELLERGAWDLLLQVFTEGHCVGHQCWHLHDPAHPAHDEHIARTLGDPVQRTYRALDRAVGELVDASGDALVLVWAGHGMSFWRGAHFLLPGILERLDVYVPCPATGVDSPGTSGAGRPAHRLLRAAWRGLPEPARKLAKQVRAAAGAPARDANDGPARSSSVPRLNVDSASSRCFPIHNGTSASGIRLNLVGREPTGLLRPGAEADEFCAELTAELLAIVDERTGDRLVARVCRTRELHAGPHVDLLPDLLVEWADDVPTGSAIVGDGSAATVRASSPRIGTVEGSNQFGRTGGHRREGWFIAAGRGIAPGRLEGGMSIYDIAPTIAARLGVDLPDSDGRVVPELASPP